VGPVLEVLGQAAASSEPCEGSLDHPSPGQNLEALGGAGALDDFGRQTRHGLLLALGEDRSLIAAVSEQLFQERISPEQRLQEQHAAVTILDVGRMNQGVQQQTYRIDENMTLLAFDLLARIIPARVDAAPPFSALLTLWLSMMAAVGLASRPIASRHFT
jgi:hypothetical protein